MQIDFHSHILPGADHGCDSVEMAGDQIDYAKEEGMNVVVATPHFYPHVDSVASFLERRDSCYHVLSCVQTTQEIKIIPGAEVLVCDRMDQMEDLKKLCIEGTDVLLLEMPFLKKMSRGVMETVLRMHLREDIRVVLAHIERYRKSDVMELLQQGLLAQVNAESICNLRMRKLCREYIATGSVVAIGSDIHGRKNNYCYFQKAQKLLRKDYDDIMYKSKQLLKF